MPTKLKGEFHFRTLSPVPTVKRILRKGRVTIVFFTDGTKAVARRPIDEPDDPYYGVCAAIAKRVAGSGTRLKKLVESAEGFDMDNGEIEKSKAEPTKKPKSEDLVQPEPSKRFEHIEINFGDELKEIFDKLFEGRDTWK